MLDMKLRQFYPPHPAQAAFAQVDRLRRMRGEFLAAAGYAPVEQPYTVLHAETGVRLRRYGQAAGEGPVVLLVPAPIKRAYIWDLEPDVSVVRRCLAEGMRVYLAEWTEAGTSAFGLADYADRLLKSCTDMVAADSGAHQVMLAGHSLGGLLATIFSCLHPQQVRALVLLETPRHFGKDSGDFAPVVAASPHAGMIEETLGSVPGSLLNVISVSASPHTFHWERLLDLSLCAGNPDMYARHMRVERWMHDELPMPGRLFSEIVESLYREDQFMQGKLCINGRELAPHHLKVPLLSVVDPRSTVIPPQSILPFHEAAGSVSKQVLHYNGDVGVGIQHVGILVGNNAHAEVWPRIFTWLSRLAVLH